MNRTQLLAIMSAIIDTNEHVMDPVARAAAILHVIEAGTPEEAIKRQENFLEQSRKELEERMEQRAREQARIAAQDEQIRKQRAREQSHGPF